MIAESVRRDMRVTTTSALRLLVFGRLAPATFFAVLGYLQLLHLVAAVRALSHPLVVTQVLSGPLPTGLYLLFCAIPVFIYVGRPAPRARDGRALPRVAGFTGTLMLLVVGVVPQGTRLYTPPPWLDATSTAISIASLTLAVCGLLYLRRSLSIIPEARRLVTGGPYRFVRHPLYAAEILAALAYVLVTPALLAVVVLLPFVVVQLQRAGYEERLLTATYPRYREYAAATPRLVPFIW